MLKIRMALLEAWWNRRAILLEQKRKEELQVQAACIDHWDRVYNYRREMYYAHFELKRNPLWMWEA